MIAIKSFGILDSEAANKFMRTHPPINTKDGSGIIMKEGAILVIYEDGTFNEEEQRKAQIHFAINDAKTQIVSKEIGLRSAHFELEKLLPEDEYMAENGQMKPESEVTSVFQKKGLSFKQAGEMSKLVLEICHKKWLAEKELHRLKNTVIPALEEMLDI